MNYFDFKKTVLGLSLGLVVVLLGFQVVGAANLRADEVVTLTNRERAKQKRTSLVVNDRLQAMAEAKAADILAQQYFEHKSPDGRTVTDLAKEAGYEYVLVGENLALGNFASSAALVKGWMNSPGHRANILQKKFTEIGVATVTGTYKGREVWVSVQEFGRPRAACPTVSANEREEIKNREVEIGLLDAQLRGLRQLVSEATTGADYNEAVAKYNAQVIVYNEAAKSLRAKVATFNGQVNAYNNCLNR